MEFRLRFSSRASAGETWHDEPQFSCRFLEPNAHEFI